MDSGGRDVTDMTLRSTSVTAAEAASRSAVLRRLRLTDLVFHNLTRFAALGVLVLLSGVIVALVVGAAPMTRAMITPLSSARTPSAAKRVTL